VDNFNITFQRLVLLKLVLYGARNLKVRSSLRRTNFDIAMAELTLPC